MENGEAGPGRASQAPLMNSGSPDGGARKRPRVVLVQKCLRPLQLHRGARDVRRDALPPVQCR